MICGRLPDIKNTDIGKYVIVIDSVTPKYDSDEGSIVINSGHVFGTNNLIDAVVTLENQVVNGKLYTLEYSVNESKGTIIVKIYELGYDSKNSTLTLTEVTDQDTLNTLKLKIIGICY